MVSRGARATSSSDAAPPWRPISRCALGCRSIRDSRRTTQFHRDPSWGDQETPRRSRSSIRASATPPRAARPCLARAPGDSHTICIVSGRRASRSRSTSIRYDDRRAARRARRAPQLYEFPLAPRAAADVAVLRELAAPEPAPAGSIACSATHIGRRSPRVLRHHRYAMARRHFARAVRGAVRAIDTLLAPGGRWLNFGSLSFHVPTRLHASVEECAAVIEENGFAARGRRGECLLYARPRAVTAGASVSSRGARTRPRTLRRCRGTRRCPTGSCAARPRALARAVPRSSHVDANPRVHHGADRREAHAQGHREGARRSAAHERAGSRGAIRSFLIKMYEDSRRGTSY